MRVFPTAFLIDQERVRVPNGSTGYRTDLRHCYVRSVLLLLTHMSVLVSFRAWPQRMHSSYSIAMTHPSFSRWLALLPNSEFQSPIKQGCSQTLMLVVCLSASRSLLILPLMKGATMSSCVPSNPLKLSHPLQVTYQLGMNYSRLVHFWLLWSADVHQ